MIQGIVRSEIMFGEFIQVDGLKISIKTEEQKGKPTLIMTNA